MTVSERSRELAEQLLDLPAHRGARRTRDEVGVEIARQRLPQHGAQVDVVHHRGPPADPLRNDDLNLCPGNGAKLLGERDVVVPARNDRDACRAAAHATACRPTGRRNVRTPASPCPRPGSRKRLTPRITASSSAAASSHRVARHVARRALERLPEAEPGVAHRDHDDAPAEPLRPAIASARRPSRPAPRARRCSGRPRTASS